MGDAAVKFITDAIDTGNLNAKPPSFDNPDRLTKSPFGAWGRWGQRTGESRSQPTCLTKRLF